MILDIQFFGLDFTSTFQEWMQQVGIFDEVLKGFIIGILVSAPMGPVGILTVQRTLNKGRLEGLATGFGACASDLLYAIITGYGMSFIVDIIENPAIALIIKVVGSVLLFGFGIYTYMSIPRPNQPIKHRIHAEDIYNQDMKQVDNSKISIRDPYFRAFAISGFVVTVSNPLIVFMFLALFGQFTFIIVDNFIPQATGYLGIIAGALTWWFSLTWLVDKARVKFNMTVLRYINRIIGIIVMLVSGIMIIYTVTGHAIPFTL